MKLTKEVADPRCLSYSICNPAVFSLSTRTRQGVLTFGGPRQEVVTKKNTVRYCSDPTRLRYKVGPVTGDPSEELEVLIVELFVDLFMALFVVVFVEEKQDKMSRDVITVGSTMRISLLYRGKYSQWRERFMNYLEEQTDGEAMINSIQNEWKQYGTLMRQTKNLMDINIDALYNILKQNQVDVNDALGYKKKAVVITSDPLALVAEKTNKAKVKDYNYYKTKMFLAKKDSDEQVLLAEDQAWMESKYYDNSTNYGLFVNNDDDQEIFHDAIESASENFIEHHIDSQKDYDKSEVNHNDFEEKEHLVDKLIRKFNHKIAKCQKRIEKANQQSKDFENQNKDLQEKYDVLINQEERYEYLIRYSALFDNDKQHRKHMVDQKLLFDKMSVELVKLDKHVRDLKNTVLEKDFKISELEECVCNKDLEIEKCLERLNVCENKLHKMGQTNQTVHMIMTYKDNLYNGRKGIGFENPSYFEKAKDLRPTLYDENVISLWYTPMFLTHFDEALKIEKFKRSRENKIEFAYDYGNLNASYVNEKINFSNDYFQEIINPDFEKIDSPFQQTKKANLKTIESLKSKGFESSENAISKSENQSENDCHVVEKECDKVENSKLISPGLFKLSVSQSVSPISMSKTSCDSKNVEIKLKRKRRKRKSSKQNDKKVNDYVSRANSDFVHFSDLDTFSSVRRPKHSGVIWKKKWSSNTSNVDLYSVSHSKLNKNVKRYSRKDLLSCNNSHLGETSSAYVCNDAMNVSCNSRLYDLFDENNLFIFDDESVRISPVSKMSFRKKPRDSMNVRSKSNSNKSLPKTVYRWLPKMKPLAEPVAKWIPRIVQIFLWIIDPGCSKHMMGNRALLTNFVEKFLGTVHFGNNDFAVIAGYEDDVVIGSMTIKKVYYVEGLGHNLFSVGQF
nr:integrase, catalytic region, zinc finger, CCHC-type, peptidase aspartic, catalytic [Tanacetum cinerariifolium]